MLRNLVLIVGLLLLLSGLIWAAQGAGIFPYPRESFMVGARPWIGYGVATAMLGAALIIVSRKLR